MANLAIENVTDKKLKQPDDINVGAGAFVAQIQTPVNQAQGIFGFPDQRTT